MAEDEYLDGDETDDWGEEEETNYGPGFSSIGDLINDMAAELTGKKINNPDDKLTNPSKNPVNNPSQKHSLASRLSQHISAAPRVERAGNGGNYTVSVYDKKTGKVMRTDSWSSLDEAEGWTALLFIESAIRYGALRNDCSLGVESYEKMFDDIDILSNENGRCFQYVPIRGGLKIMKKQKPA